MDVKNVVLKRSTYVYISTFIYVCAFFVFAYIGFRFGNYEIIGNTSAATVNQNSLFCTISDYTFKGILLNNEIYITKNYLGIFTCGIYPVILLSFNAGLFGMIAGKTVVENGLVFVLIHTLPHCFELVAVVLAAADSMFLGIFLFSKYFHYHNREINYKTYILNFVLYTIIIAIAAYCEANVSMKIW